MYQAQAAATLDPNSEENRLLLRTLTKALWVIIPLVVGLMLGQMAVIKVHDSFAPAFMFDQYSSLLATSVTHTYDASD